MILTLPSPRPPLKKKKNSSYIEKQKVEQQ